MTICLHDRYYIPEDDDCYPDDWDWKVEQYTFELLNNDFNYRDEYNWAEGLSETSNGDESIYPTPSHAPVEVVQAVSAYWYEVAFKRATDYYEENPHAD
jgi:hypothetical protein